MIVLSLDISSKTGWSVFNDGKLSSYGQEVSLVSGGEQGDYPLNLIRAAKKQAKFLAEKAKECKAYFVVIEETNLGKNRYSQKVLEFFHCVIVDAIACACGKDGLQIKYMDSSEWRGALGLALSSEQRENNKKLKGERNAKKISFSEEWWKEHHDSFLDEIAGLKKRDSNKVKKTYDTRCNKYISDNLRKFRTKGSKTNYKHLSVQYINKNYDLKLKMKDNDIADSICLGEAFIKLLGDI